MRKKNVIYDPSTSSYASCLDLGGGAPTNEIPVAKQALRFMLTCLNDIQNTCGLFLRCRYKRAVQKKKLTLQCIRICHD